MTLDEDCVIQETFHVFLGACSGNVARTAVHPAVHILGQLPEFRWAAQASHVLSLEGPGPWEGPRPPLHHLPGNSGWLFWGWWRVVFREQRSPAFHPGRGPGPAGQALSLSLGDRDLDASSHRGHTHVMCGKLHLSLGLSLTLHTVGYPKAFPSLRDLKLETLGLGLGSSHQQDRKGPTGIPTPIPHKGRDTSAFVPDGILSPKASLLPPT